VIGGEWLRPIVYKQIACIARFVPGIDIMACGGIGKPEHVVESMMLGAKAVEMVTPVLFKGRKLLTRDVRFLEKYMEEQG
jgi:dihydroorotate dehydrogenase